MRQLIRYRAPREWMEMWGEDAAQETVVDLFRSYQACKATSEGQFRAWLNTVAQRRIAQIHRRETRHTGRHAGQYEVENVPAPTDRFETSLDREWQVAQIKARLDSLSSNDQLLIWYRIVNEDTWHRIGQELGISASASKRRYQRIIARFRRI